MVFLQSSWLQDLEDRAEFQKSFAILQGSFANPEMAQKMMKAENPDFVSDDEAMDQTMEDLKKENETIKNNRHRRKKRAIKN